MKCKDATEILERMIFEDVAVDASLRQHLETCSACSQLYGDTLKSRGILALVRLSEPLLANPGGVTDRIMDALPQRPQKPFMVPFNLQRLLAAATVALFLLFGYEQYNVVSKVSAMESRFTGINADSCYSNPMRLASAVNINTAGISFAELEKFLSGIERIAPLSVANSKKRLFQKEIK